jgi:glucans biosynthesis protein
MRDNPLRGQCGARTRFGAPCRAPKVAGKKRCRMHGGASGSGAPKGERNGNWRHGRFTCEAIAERQAARGVLRSARDMLTALAGHAGSARP